MADGAYYPFGVPLVLPWLSAAVPRHRAQGGFSDEQRASS